LNSIAPNLWEEVSDCWRSEKEPQIDRTHIACFSDAPVGDFTGNERRWESYGHVAFHFDPAFMRGDAPDLGLYLVKVTYGKDRVEKGLLDLLKTLRRHREHLAGLPRGPLASIVRHRLWFTSVATKSEEFAWENEWRLIHSPHLFASAHIEKKFDGTGEKQQPIYPLPLRNTVDRNNPLLSLPNLLRNVAIRSSGSSEDQELRCDVIKLLRYHGVSDAADRVHLNPGPHAQVVGR
jgi:hypothetical protein